MTTAVHAATTTSSRPKAMDARSLLNEPRSTRDSVTVGIQAMMVVAAVGSRSFMIARNSGSISTVRAIMDQIGRTGFAPTRLPSKSPTETVNRLPRITAATASPQCKTRLALTSKTTVATIRQ